MGNIFERYAANIKAYKDLGFDAQTANMLVRLDAILEVMEEIAVKNKVYEKNSNSK